MIKASELRIGNWLKGHDPSYMGYSVIGYFKVKNIGEEINLWRVGSFSDESAIHIEPIPLTSEILEKCGFKNRRVVYDQWRLNDCFTLNDNDGLYLEGNDGTEIGIEIKYLHQLQNLYFALTGEELEVKL